MAIVRFDPFRGFVTLQDRLYGNLPERATGVERTGEWAPPVDIFETDAHELVIKAELPDMAREDIDITVDSQALTLRGTKARPTGIKDEQFRRVERSYGTFSRSFTLPNTVDAGKITADYKNGVLTVTLPFREEAKPRTVTVNVAAA